MIISWHGGGCLLVEEKERGAEVRSALFFPYTKTSKARTLEMKADVIIAQEGLEKIKSDAFIIETPGEYDVAKFMFHSIKLRGSDDSANTEDAFAYVIDTDHMTLLYISCGVSQLEEREIEQIGAVDILAVPIPFMVDRENKNIDPVAGLGKFVRTIEPNAVIAMTNDSKLKKATSAELGTDGETINKFTVAQKDLLDEGYRLVFLEAQ